MWQPAFSIRRAAPLLMQSIIIFFLNSYASTHIHCALIHEACLAYDAGPQDVECYDSLARSTSTSPHITAICRSSPYPMPPRRSRSREREPPCGLSPPEEPSNMQFPASSTRGRSGSSHPQASGESIFQQKPEDPAFNTSVSLVWGINDGAVWATVKIRQHAQDP